MLVSQLARAPVDTHPQDITVSVIRSHGGSHPNIHDGDTLIVQECGACSHCEPDENILIEMHGQYVVTQKNLIAATLRRRGLYLVGKPSTVVVGRVIVWVKG